MSLLLFGGRRSPLDSFYREMRDIERAMAHPHWHAANFLDFNSAADVGQVTNDADKYGLKLDVSHFRPEELQVHLDGRKLTVEGKHESRTEHGSTQRSFVRSFLLPEDVDVAAVSSNLTNEGHLAIEAPKVATTRGRAIPITRASNEAITAKPKENAEKK
ncbi:unnamed protein product [Caenorhabditis auriculariae]|uniref:SHSP domain-containing protein n=1 Tax=Caenorhabditis auriculariae TaxID=2777116 RepID=A0A8S1HEQ9_9PELO|nr:unnamed protein product [Caenorhabditis auriculariae]